MTAERASGIVFTVLAVILAILLLRMHGPAPEPASAPLTEFSAGRAMGDLRAILSGDDPHPVGVPAHEAVFNRLVARLQSLGYEVHVQRTFSCNSQPTCAPVANVIADLPGDARADILLVTAHYDSVPAGPGASDDGIGVAAVVEVARILKKEHFRNTIRFLVTDGEEAGLLGAEAFVADPQMSNGAAAVINVEDRGTSGPSFLFETSPHNRWLVTVIAKVLPRPSATSLSYEIYRLLPNDTDLTVFKRAGMAGVNFAAIGHVVHYHTPLDNLAHVSPRLVQEHGEHILAMARALASSNLRQSTEDNAVYFDLLGFVTFWWPQRWTMIMAVATLLVLLIAAGARIQRRETAATEISVGVLSFFASIIGAAVLGTIAAWIISLRSPAAIWAPQPGPSIAAGWLIGIATAISVAHALHASAGFEGLFIGHALGWTALSIALAKFLPGASYVALVPAAVMALSIALTLVARVEKVVGAIVSAVAAALVLFQLGLLFYDAFGRPAIVATAALTALIATTFSPLIAAALALRRPIAMGMFGAAVACIAMQLIIPPFTKESPRRLNIRYVDDDRGSHWEADTVTPQLRSVASFESASVEAPWLPRGARIDQAPAPRLAITAPVAQIIGDEHAGGRHLRLRITSSRGAQRISLTFRASSFNRLTVNGVTPPAASLRHQFRLASGWHRASVIGAPEAVVDLFLNRDESIEGFIADYSYGLPAAGAPLARARDESLAVPSDSGDGVLVMRRVRL